VTVAIVAIIALACVCLALVGLVISERLGRERLIRYLEADTPAEVALLERATKRHPNEKAVHKVTVTDPLELP
jgi:hypothetical protein